MLPKGKPKIERSRMKTFVAPNCGQRGTNNISYFSLSGRRKCGGHTTSSLLGVSFPRQRHHTGLEIKKNMPNFRTACSRFLQRDDPHPASLFSAILYGCVTVPPQQNTVLPESQRGSALGMEPSRRSSLKPQLTPETGQSRRPGGVLPVPMAGHNLGILFSHGPRC